MVDGLLVKTIILSAKVIASSMLWVTNITDFFSFLTILYTSLQIINLVWLSKAEKGSSSSNKSGFIASVLIRATL